MAALYQGFFTFGWVGAIFVPNGCVGCRISPYRHKAIFQSLDFCRVDLEKKKLDLDRRQRQRAWMHTFSNNTMQIREDSCLHKPLLQTVNM